MPINLIDKIKHANGKDPVVDAEDVAMPDGSRLSEFNPVFPLMEGAQVLEPEVYYDFGAVDSLEVELAAKNDGKAHEYAFEFTPTAGFQGLTITPEPQWIGTPQYPAGRRCVVSIVLRMAVMGNA